MILLKICCSVHVDIEADFAQEQATRLPYFVRPRDKICHTLTLLQQDATARSQLFTSEWFSSHSDREFGVIVSYDHIDQYNHLQRSCYPGICAGRFSKRERSYWCETMGVHHLDQAAQFALYRDTCTSTL